MDYRIAIFDFDGTLADSFPFFVGISNELADRHGFRRIDPAEIESLRGQSARAMLKHVGLPLWKMPLVGRSFKTLMAERGQQVQAFPGAVQMLHTLRARGLLLGLVTSNSAANVARILGSDAMDAFRHPQCGTSLFGKPARLRSVLRQTGIPAAQAIYIGDELRDLEAARAVRLAFGAVSWGYTRADALAAQQPTLLFRRMDDIAAALRPAPSIVT